MSKRISLSARLRAGERALAPLDWALAALTPLQRMGMAYRLRQPRIKVDAYVIAFGNITVGGTGKTPAVIERATQEVAAGKTVAIVSRGYGSERCDEPFIVVPGEAVDGLASIAGDELALIRMRVPEVTIVKSADRVAGARAAIEQGCDTIILDDAYQAVQLERDENICVVDASLPFGNGHIIPRGILREPLNALGRATHFILTHCDQCDDVNALTKQLQHYSAEASIRTTQHSVTGLWRVSDGASFPLTKLTEQPVHGACAIAHPDQFRATLETYTPLASFHSNRDHATFLSPTLPDGEILVVTEKDAVKMVQAKDWVFALGISLKGY